MLTSEQIYDIAEMVCAGASCTPQDCDCCQTPPADGEDCPQFIIQALLKDRAELQAGIERLMTRNEELARVVDRYTGTDYMERLHAVARAAQEIVDGLPYRGVRDFPELREELRCLKALEGEA